MSLRVEKTEFTSTDSTLTTKPQATEQEQTFNYQPSEDDKNAGLQVESKSQTQTNAEEKTKNEPSTGKLILNRGAAIVLAPITGVAGVLTIVAGGINGAVNPNKTFDSGMTEGIQAAGQGADMLEKMWQGRFF